MPTQKFEPDKKKGDTASEAGNIRFGDNFVVGNNQRITNTSGSSYIEGNVNVGGGTFIGRDNDSLKEIERLFNSIYNMVESLPKTTVEDKADLAAEVMEIQNEINKGEQVNTNFIERRLRNIGRMAPDVLEVLVATLGNPLTGLGVVVKKVARRTMEEFGNVQSEQTLKYVVQPTDTLFGIAMRFRVTIQVIMELNPELQNSNNIVAVGQTLQIPKEKL